MDAVGPYPNSLLKKRFGSFVRALELAGLCEYRPQWGVYICAFCRKRFKWFLSQPRTYCSADCRYRDWVGEKHPGWKGGYEPYYGPDWPFQRRACLERDDYRCRDCGRGKEDLGQNPDVHHTIKFRLSHDNGLENLVTLCRECHARRERLMEARAHHQPRELRVGPLQRGHRTSLLCRRGAGDREGPQRHGGGPRQAGGSRHPGSGDSPRDDASEAVTDRTPSLQNGRGHEE